MRILILFLLIVGLNSSVNAIESPLLTEPLPQIKRSDKVSVDYLLNAQRDPELNASLDWLDQSHIMFASDENIHVFDLDQKSYQTIGKGLHPIPSPNGEWIAFLDLVDEINEIYQIGMMRRDGSERQLLAFFDQELKGFPFYDFGFSWSPDSKQIAVYVNPFIQYWDIPIEIPHSQIFLIDLDSNQAKCLFSDKQLIQYVTWYPDGDRLLFFKIYFKQYHRTKEDWTSVQSLLIKNSEVLTLTAFNGMQQILRPKISPKGNFVSLLYAAENHLFNWMLSLGIVSANSTNLSPLQLTFDVKLTNSIWSKDENRLFVIRNYGPYDQIYSVNAQTLEMKQVTHSSSQKRQLRISPDGSHLLWLNIDGQNSYKIQMASIEDLKIQDLMIQSLQDVSLCEVREIEWETVDYPSKLRGLLYLPLDYQKGKSYPLVVDVHGGGPGAQIFLSGGILLDSSLEWQLWAAKGYAVFIPEFRSSAAFGFLAIKRDLLERGEMINWDAIDIIAGVDELVKQGIVDQNRVALIGHSAGGRRANWMTVSSDRFKVVISKEGWVDETNRGLDEKECGYTSSALYHLEGACTPTLFLMGNSKLGGLGYQGNPVIRLYEALKAKGIETEYIEYADEGHCFESPKNRREALEKTVDWIDRHIGNNSKTQ